MPRRHAALLIERVAGRRARAVRAGLVELDPAARTLSFVARAGAAPAAASAAARPPRCVWDLRLLPLQDVGLRWRAVVLGPSGPTLVLPAQADHRAVVEFVVGACASDRAEVSAQHDTEHNRLHCTEESDSRVHDKQQTLAMTCTDPDAYPIAVDLIAGDRHNVDRSKNQVAPSAPRESLPIVISPPPIEPALAQGSFRRKISRVALKRPSLRRKTVPAIRPLQHMYEKTDRSLSDEHTHTHIVECVQQSHVPGQYLPQEQPLLQPGRRTSREFSTDSVVKLPLQGKSCGRIEIASKARPNTSKSHEPEVNDRDFIACSGAVDAAHSLSHSSYPSVLSNVVVVRKLGQFDCLLLVVTSLVVAFLALIIVLLGHFKRHVLIIEHFALTVGQHDRPRCLYPSNL
jgi:hypothetical protein